MFVQFRESEYVTNLLSLNTNSLSHGLSLFQEGKSVKKDTSKDAKAKDTAVPKPETKAESTRPSEAEASAP
ncbi:hypothetical protein Tco_0399568, partial [Tanacetum coccineum]